MDSSLNSFASEDLGFKAGFGMLESRVFWGNWRKDLGRGRMKSADFGSAYALNFGPNFNLPINVSSGSSYSEEVSLDFGKPEAPSLDSTFVSGAFIESLKNYKTCSKTGKSLSSCRLLGSNYDIRYRFR